MINKEKSLIQKLLPHALAIVAFLAITIVYFSPVFQGQVLPQHDTAQYQAMSQELREYYNNEGQSSEWTGAMFSGMPAYQIGVWGGSPNILDYVEAPLKALGGSTAGPVFAGMLMAYILFVVMGFSPVVAALGAIAYSLSSYNIIIITAGHVTKAWAIAYLPLIVAGLMALFKRKFLLGGLFFALGLALQIKNNHLQITYYTGLLCAILYIYFLIESIAKKNIKDLAKGTGVLAVGLIIALACNLGNIYANYEMGKTSIRGKSELTTPLTHKEDAEADPTDAGRDKDKDYAFAWSYGKAESFTLLVPNLYGGLSKPFDDNSNSYKALVQRAQSGEVSPEMANSLLNGIRQYWGDQPSTSGPVYFGAIICFLFVLGMIIIKDNLKWALFAATVFFLFLSWGGNFTGFNDWFYYHFPFYNKFRAVSMALVIPAITMLIVAIWAIKVFFEENGDKKQLTKALYIAGGIVGFVCLLLWVAPGTFTNFTADADKAWSAQVPGWYYDALIADRKDMMSADAGRSLLFVLLSFAVLWFALRTKMEKAKVATYATLAVIVLVLIDLWGVDKRYLNGSNFENKVAYQQSLYPKSTADNAILSNNPTKARVLQFAKNVMNPRTQKMEMQQVDPVNDATPAFYHRTVGGYHAAKLKRYQELIEYRLGGEIAFVQKASFNAFNSAIQKLQAAQQQGEQMDPQSLPLAVQDSVAPLLRSANVMNMLNMKYVIYHPELPPVINPYALGNAWFVKSYETVDNADQELASLKTLIPADKAIVDKRFDGQLSGLNVVADSTATIEQTSYKPNVITYKTKAASEQLAVFSEVYYDNGWQAYIDGKPVDHMRADWILRALRVPAGEHEVVFKFEPHAYRTCRGVATASSGILTLLLIASIIFAFVPAKRKEA